MRKRLIRRLGACGLAGGLSVGVFVGLSGTPASPAVTESNGNVTSCAQIGLGGDTQVAGAGDSNVTIAAGSTSITVTVVGAGVVVDAVVVKGGPNANIYQPGGSGTFSTPTNPNTGQPYGLSHYFVCYRIVQVTTTVATTTPTTLAPATAGQAVQPRPAVQPQTVVRVQPRLTG